MYMSDYVYNVYSCGQLLACSKHIGDNDVIDKYQYAYRCGWSQHAPCFVLRVFNDIVTKRKG